MKSIFLFCALSSVPVLAFAQGGPPMVTDDPGTPGDRHWEINIASLLGTQANQALVQFPYFDINYGWGTFALLVVGDKE